MTGHHDHAAAASWGGLLVMALVMALMMAPFLIEPLTHVRERTLRHLRVAAASEFSLTYVAAWFAIAIVLLALARPITHAWDGTLVFGLACVGLAVWQLSDTRVRVATRCGPSFCPQPSGWRSHLGASWGGAREAGSCARSSGGSMVLMVLAPALGLMVLVWVIHVWEMRPGRDPFIEARTAQPAIAYAGLAVSTLAFTLV